MAGADAAGRLPVPQKAAAAAQGCCSSCRCTARGCAEPAPQPLIELRWAAGCLLLLAAAGADEVGWIGFKLRVVNAAHLVGDAKCMLHLQRLLLHCRDAAGTLAA